MKRFIKESAFFALISLSAMTGIAFAQNNPTAANNPASAQNAAPVQQMAPAAVNNSTPLPTENSGFPVPEFSEGTAIQDDMSFYNGSIDNYSGNGVYEYDDYYAGPRGHGVLPLIKDVGEIALTPVYLVASLFSAGVYPDCGCAPKVKRVYNDPCDRCGNWSGSAALFGHWRQSCSTCGENGSDCATCGGNASFNNSGNMPLNAPMEQSLDSEYQQNAMPTPDGQSAPAPTPPKEPDQQATPLKTEAYYMQAEPARLALRAPISTMKISNATNQQNYNLPINSRTNSQRMTVATNYPNQKMTYRSTGAPRLGLFSSSNGLFRSFSENNRSINTLPVNNRQQVSMQPVVYGAPTVSNNVQSVGSNGQSGNNNRLSSANRVSNNKMPSDRQYNRQVPVAWPIRQVSGKLAQ